jgi:hypothetical protein
MIRFASRLATISRKLSRKNSKCTYSRIGIEAVLPVTASGKIMEPSTITMMFRSVVIRRPTEALRRSEIVVRSRAFVVAVTNMSVSAQQLPESPFKDKTQFLTQFFDPKEHPSVSVLTEPGLSQRPRAVWWAIYA